MRWFYLVAAAFGTGLILLPPHDYRDAVCAFFSVVMFGIFIDDCLERHRS